MAYAALSSLMYTLEQLSNPNQSFVLPSCTQQHVQSLYQNLSHLQLFLDDTTKDIETLKVIEKRIRDVVYEAEDKVDSSLRSIILADCTENRQEACKFFEEELLKVEEDVHSLRKEVMQIEFNNHGSRSAELATTSSSPDKNTIEENTIVGMEDEYNTILDRLIAQTDELTIIAIYGMGGIGEDLQRWEAGCDNFPMLEQLLLQQLYHLEEIPESFGEIMTLKFILIESCGSAVETSAMKIQEEQQSFGNYDLQIQIIHKRVPQIEEKIHVAEMRRRAAVHFVIHNLEN